MPNYDELWTLIQRIPSGRVSCYGDLGKALRNPVSGLLVGRWMRSSPPGVPWWRVVGKNGSFLIGRQSPELAIEQEQRIIAEGVKVEGGRVTTTAFIAFSDLFED